MNNIESLTSNNFHNEIPRCPNCNLICSINLIKKTNQSYIRFLCENKNAQIVIKARMRLKENFFIVLNVINLYVIFVKVIIKYLTIIFVSI